MFRGCLATLVVGILMFIVVVGVILLIAWGLSYVLDYIPCEILVYIETGLLLGIFMLIAGLLMQNGDKLMGLFKINQD